MRGGEIMIPASLLSLLTVVVCKKVLDEVFEDERSTFSSSVMKDHDTITQEFAHDLIQYSLENESEDKGE